MKRARKKGTGPCFRTMSCLQITPNGRKMDQSPPPCERLPMKLIVGCGYLGSHVARRWLAAGQQVTALVRHAPPSTASPPSSFLLPPSAVRIADITQPATLGQLPAAETVLYAVGYDPLGGRSREEVVVEGLKNVLDALPPDTGRIVFISSTGVYGDMAGARVDEQSPCRPAREAGRLLLAAEQLLSQHPLGPRSVILRLAGLYGPGRLPPLADLSSGAPLAVPADSLVNLIHVEDAATAVLAAESRAQPPCMYLVSDGHPIDRRRYLSHLAELSGLPPPRFCDSSTAAVGARSRRAGNKRISNARLVAELGVAFAYPTYLEGLAASVAPRSAATHPPWP